MSALGFLIKKEFIQFRRNRFVSRLVFLLPIIVMLIVPLVANMDVKGVNVAVVDMDRSGLSGRMVSHLEASKQLRVRLVVTDYRQAYDLLEAGKVDVIVTDSPLILSIIYQTDPRLGQEFNDLVMKIFNSYDNMSYFLRRVKPYNPVGRFQTEEESDALSEKIKSTFDKIGIPLTEIDGCTEGYDRIVRDVLERLGRA